MKQTKKSLFFVVFLCLNRGNGHGHVFISHLNCLELGHQETDKVVDMKCCATKLRQTITLSTQSKKTCRNVFSFRVCFFFSYLFSPITQRFSSLSTPGNTRRWLLTGAHCIAPRKASEMPRFTTDKAGKTTTSNDFDLVEQRVSHEHCPFRQRKSIVSAFPLRSRISWSAVPWDLEGPGLFQ